MTPFSGSKNEPGGFIGTSWARARRQRRCRRAGMPLHCVNHVKISEDSVCMSAPFIMSAKVNPKLNQWRTIIFVLIYPAHFLVQLKRNSKFTIKYKRFARLHKCIYRLGMCPPKHWYMGHYGDSISRNVIRLRFVIKWPPRAALVSADFCKI